MYFLLSPAKSLNEKDAVPIAIEEQYSQPNLMESACRLMSVLKTKEPTDIMELMHVSEKIAQLNAERNQHWAWSADSPFTTEVSTETNTSANMLAKPAVYLFDGGVYTGLDVYNMDKSTVEYLNSHLGILSGLYGLLKPLDLILPYRLEMGTKLANDKGENLYEFWDTQISELINQRMAELAESTTNSEEDNVLINLASNEYFKSVKEGALTAKVITPRFEDEKNGKFKVISFYAKKARGLMVKYASDNKLTNAEDLKNFDLAGYYFYAEGSDDKTWTFRRAEQV